MTANETAAGLPLIDHILLSDAWLGHGAASVARVWGGTAGMAQQGSGRRAELRGLDLRRAPPVPDPHAGDHRVLVDVQPHAALDQRVHQATLPNRSGAPSGHLEGPQSLGI